MAIRPGILQKIIADQLTPVNRIETLRPPHDLPES
jgi:hypothetical protein